MRALRGGMGFGDALYVQAVARHLVAGGQSLRILTAYPELFRPLNGSVETAPFSRAGNPIVAHYTTRKGVPGTTQFEDVCRQAGIGDRVELRLDWKIQNQRLVDDVRSRAGLLPIVLVQLMRPPMNRKDRFGASLLPDGRAVQACVDRLRGRAHLVLVGTGPCLYRLEGCDEDLCGRTTVSDVVDLASAASGLLGYVSFFVPLAESLSKPGLYVWSARGLRDPVAYVRQITPAKAVHRADLATVVRDDAPVGDLESAADRFLEAARAQA